MSHPDQLRQYARDCLRLSQDVTSAELKIQLIKMAETWAALAAQSERLAEMNAAMEAEGIASPSLAMDAAPCREDDAGAPVSMESPALSPDPPAGAMTEPRRPESDGSDSEDR